jgi:uncharacterized protein (TIRG00374 family)
MISWGRLRKAVGYIAFLLLGLGLFSWALSRGERSLGQLWQDMLEVPLGGLTLSMFMGYLAIVSRGMRWRLMLEPLGFETRRWHSIHAVSFAYLANTFVPRSGELARCGALNQTDRIPVDVLFGTVLIERVIDMAVLALFLLVAILGNAEAFAILAQSMEIPLGMPLLLSMAAGGLGMLYLGYRLRKRWKSKPGWARVVNFMEGMKSGLLSVSQMRRKWAFFAHTAFIWGMYYGTAQVIFATMPATSDLSALEGLFAMVAGGLGMVLPAPGGIGSYQWAIMLAFSALGREQATGFLVANVMWLSQTLMMVATGIIAYGMLVRFRLRNTPAN